MIAVRFPGRCFLAVVERVPMSPRGQSSLLTVVTTDPKSLNQFPCFKLRQSAIHLSNIQI